MAALTSRWSRATAAERWSELHAFNGTVLGFGIPLMALWPLVSMIGHWGLYTDPWVVTAVYAGSLLLPLGVWRLGPRGIGLGTSLASIAAVLCLCVVVADQIDDALLAEVGVGNWITSWGAATFFVLTFARPVEEILVAFVAFVGVNYMLDFPANPDIYLLHVAPSRIGAVVPGAVAILAVITALRVGVRGVTRSRALAAAAEQRLAVAEAVARERAARFVFWEADVAPLLEDIAEGRRDVTDPAVTARCRSLAADLRAQLSAAADSLFAVLLRDQIDALQSRGGNLAIQDIDVGFRLPESDRMRVAGLAADLCRTPDAPSVGLTLIRDVDDASALVMLSVTGTPIPDTPAWSAARHLAGGMLSNDSTTRWFWDATFALDPAPALPKPPGSAARA